MGRRNSNAPAVTAALAGIGLLVGSMMTPWIAGREGAQIPMRALWPADLARPEVTAFVDSIGVPLLVLAGLVLIAILGRSRGLALGLAGGVLLLVGVWVLSEAIRRSPASLRLSQLDSGWWLALLGAIALMVGAYLVPHERRPGR